MRNKFAFLTGLWALVVLHATTTSAQSLSDVNPDVRLVGNSGADGASLNSISNPNLYDGSTTVAIPIYNYQSAEGQDLGISFSYNTKGIKADQKASSIGLNWVLNSGPSIHRVVKDIPDDLNINSFYTDIANWGGGYIDFNKMRGLWAIAYLGIETGTYLDKESDDFIITLGGEPFTLNFDEYGGIFTAPERRIKVEILVAGVPLNFGVYPFNSTPTAGSLSNPEFRVTDEQGVVYYFIAGDKEGRTLTTPHTVPWGDRTIAYSSAITRWVISKIILSNGSVINYTYEPTNTSEYRSLESSFESAAGVTLSMPTVSSWESGKQLTQISYPNDVTVLFQYETNPNITRCDLVSFPPIRGINVSSGSNCQMYKLHQSYYVAAYNGNTTYSKPYGTPCGTLGSKAHRLKLDSIQILNCPETKAELYYRFEYDPMPLGYRGSGEDYFGYYNGNVAVNPGGPGTMYVAGFSPNLSIPDHWVWNLYPTRFGLDKTPNFAYAKAGIITKVSNAYGGELSFVYEQHEDLTNPILNDARLSVPTSDPLFLGVDANDGIRLKSITEKSGSHGNNTRVTTYTYEEGERFLVGGYYHFPTKLTDFTSHVFASVMFSNRYVTPHHLFNGSNHGYGKVTATVTAGGNQLSRVVQTFTNFKKPNTNGTRYDISLTNTSKYYYQFPYTDKSYMRTWEMGRPLVTTHYDQNDHIVKKITNFYNESVLYFSSIYNYKVVDLEYIGASPITNDWKGQGITVNQVKSHEDVYLPYRGRANLLWTTEYTYFDDNAYYATDSIWYGYDYYNNISTVSTKRSNGDILTKHFFYNYSVSNPPIGSALRNMNLAGLEKVVGTETWKTIGATRGLIDATINTYNFENNKLSTKGVYNLAVSQQLTPCQYKGECGGTPPPPYSNVSDAFYGNSINYFRKTNEASLWDAKGNILENRLLKQDQYESRVWDTITGQKLAEVNNARYNEIAYSSFEDKALSFGNMTPHRGNWMYLNSNIETMSGAPSGRRVFRLDAPGGVANAITGTQNLAPQKYLLSFWVKGTAKPILDYGSGAFTSVTIPAPVYGPTAAGWYNYQVVYKANTSGVFRFRTPGGNMYVDELRLHPFDAQMVSTTHYPLFGKSSVTDVTGRITYYEYDSFGRLHIVRDQEGNILSKVKQVIQGAD